MKRLIQGAVASLLLTIASTTTHAAIIDFTSNDFVNVGAGPDNSTFTSMAYDVFGKVTLTSFVTPVGGTLGQGGKLTFNDGGDAGTCSLDPNGLACFGDGIGIDNDEVSEGQKLEVRFEFAVNLVQIDLLDLFQRGARGDNTDEIAIITVDGNTPIDILPTGPTGSDSGFVSLNQTFNNVIGFDLTTRSNGATSDVALARIEATAVSAPATLGLLGLGLAVIASFARRSKK